MNKPFYFPPQETNNKVNVQNIFYEDGQAVCYWAKNIAHLRSYSSVTLNSCIKVAKLMNFCVPKFSYLVF